MPETSAGGRALNPRPAVGRGSRWPRPRTTTFPHAPRRTLGNGAVRWLWTFNWHGAYELTQRVAEQTMIAAEPECTAELR